jgi:hypothetical protein
MTFQTLHGEDVVAIATRRVICSRSVTAHKHTAPVGPSRLAADG